MPAPVVCAFEDDAVLARHIAELAQMRLGLIGQHRFPDRETLVRAPPVDGDVVLVRRLHDPDAKLMPLLLAADALKRSGARRLILVAPYLPYMRQDRVFGDGEPLSRDVFGRVVGERFDDIITIAPHLHRTASLSAVFRPARAVALSAAPSLALASPWPRSAVAVGPDAESAPWVQEAAGLVGADWTVCAKRRTGDRNVTISLRDQDLVRGRPVVLLDDIASSGATLAAAARAVRAAGATRIEARVVHAFFKASAAAGLRKAGVERIFATDSAPHASSCWSVAPQLAQALLSLRLGLDAEQGVGDAAIATLSRNATPTGDKP